MIFALQLFALLLIGHALADYPLQGDFLARAKNRFAAIPGVPWVWALGSHAAIHAGFVWVITGTWWLGLLEFVAHAAIDDWKCAVSARVEGRRMQAAAFHMDQIAHVACKLAWAVLAAWLT